MEADAVEDSAESEGGSEGEGGGGDAAWSAEGEGSELGGLAGMTVADLKERCKAAGLKVSAGEVPD